VHGFAAYATGAAPRRVAVGLVPHQRLGTDSRVLTAQANLADAYWQAGRTGEAIIIEEKVAADRLRILGPEHPDTQAAAGALREWESQ
jgi:hypothetical protein